MRRKWLWVVAVVIAIGGSHMRFADAGTGYEKLKEGAVRIWDVNEQYTMKHYDLRAWKDRANWSQVPYGTTDYTFKGDCVLEGANFWISLHSSGHDAVFLYAKVDAEGKPSRHNEIYRSYDTDIVLSDGKYGWNEHPGRLRCYGSSSGSAKILKNDPDELIVESTSLPHVRPGFPEGFSVEVTTAYRIPGGKRWVEISPVHQASEQGMHGESRILIVPDGTKEGVDFVTDAHKEQGGAMGAHGVWLPDNSKMLLDLAMDIDTIWLMTWPDPFKARPYGVNCHGGWKSGWQHIGEDSFKIFSSPFARFGGGTEPVIIGVLFKDYWHYQRINEQVTEGQVFEGTWKRALTRPLPHGEYPVGSPWKPGYPGIWRTIGCINGEYYTQEGTVSGEPTSNFSFTCPAAGTLETLITYLYERSDETPQDVSTPMDIYREAIQGN